MVLGSDTWNKEGGGGMSARGGRRVACFQASAISFHAFKETLDICRQASAQEAGVLLGYLGKKIHTLLTDSKVSFTPSCPNLYDH